MENQKVLTKKQNITQAVKFTLFSASAGIIETVSFALLSELGKLPYWPCYLVALILSVLYNFTLNRHFTFMSVANIPVAMLKVAGFYLMFTPLSTWWGDALTNAGWNKYIVLFGTMVINLITEFTFYRFVVYKDSMYTNKRAKKQMEKELTKNL
ncbi:MAG: GtrA family protein [Bacillota bacterium]|nr:GtrA family protein [Bacillota bacterium]